MTARPPGAPDAMRTDGKLIVITGPSGAGKSSIVRDVLGRTGAAYSVSMTTRAPRPGEVDGRDYRFVSREAFEREVAAGQMLESAEVFGALYGTPAGPVRDALGAGRAVILELDVQGGLQVAEQAPDATFVLIVPPSDAELERRLRGRGTEDEDTVQRRLAKARAEMATARRSGVYNHEVVNDELERAVQEMCRLIRREMAKE